ncbi:hypothetical protein JD844_022254 [Phrynosoma platyrhinos]|uniref:Lysine-specific metallo-endopeptidase domain-containing protein n=1 Tax=Phrynosoma platyrhinos TaxID=52577 RepID=A0ABQ7SV40_PHRPL|nr:hypothetical protein JD844_022254 [Phrynosoma platyrhinos]
MTTGASNCTIMSSKVFVCVNQGNERYCFRGVLKPDEAANIQNLTEEEAKIAEAVKQGAIEVLQDALKKKDRVLMKEPEKVVLTGEEKDKFWMKRHAIVTEDLVKKLLAELKKVRFKKKIDSNAYASVIIPDDTRTIYLGNPFWNAPKYLGRNSQPGTLIHEVSHFLGTDDIAYGMDVKPTLYVGCQGTMIKGNLRSAQSSDVSLSEEDYKDALKKAACNADNVAYEFELTLNHKGIYVGDKYSCCGETARYSVCDQSVPDFFHTCRVGKKWETESLIKEACGRSQTIRGALIKHQSTADEIKKCLRKAKTSRKAGLAGGAAAAGGILLAPATFGFSAMVAGGVGLAGAAFISMKIFQGRATSKKKELDDTFAECQSFLDDVRRVIAFLNYEPGFQRDFGIQYRAYSCLEHITILKEQVESEKDVLQKIYRYKEGIIQCANLLESLGKILFDKTNPLSSDSP